MTRIALALAALVTVLALAGSAGASRQALLLTGTVGPGFTIKVNAKKVPAGIYLITVKDLSGLHDFHLIGPGVNKHTSVATQGTTKWKVKLRKGTYRYFCDAHPTTMKGSLKVT
jgi:plastocyanin